MNILITGASGLIGTALGRHFVSQGHRVYPLSRKDKHAPFYWQPDREIIQLDENIQLDVVINLAGENIADGRWSQQRKKRIFNSRIESTRLLSKTLAGLSIKPHTFVSGSAIGYYGNRNTELMDEQSRPGTGFLADIATEWEHATSAAESAGIRTIHLRTGIVLSRDGGVLKKMLMPFQLGLGGVIGNGQQYMSWISIRDMVSAVQFLIENERLAGAFNMVAPAPVTNREFTKGLGHVLHRPTLFPMPALLVHLLFGEMGDELLLSSTRVKPARLLDNNYTFIDTDFQKTLYALIHNN